MSPTSGLKKQVRRSSSLSIFQKMNLAMRLPGCLSVRIPHPKEMEFARGPPPRYQLSGSIFCRELQWDVSCLGKWNRRGGGFIVPLWFPHVAAVGLKVRSIALRSRSQFHASVGGQRRALVEHGCPQHSDGEAKLWKFHFPAPLPL